MVEFHGGWVGNPLLSNVAGYINQTDAMLTVRMKDEGSGIFVRPQRQEYVYDEDCDGEIDPEDLREDPILDDEECYIAIDWGIKYDLWRVDGEDEQADIDEFEERELLHQGTADELLPYLDPPLYGTGDTYDPSDELMVQLPIVGGGRIADGDILEVVVYSQKTRTVLGEGPGLGCDVVDTLTIGGELFYILEGCWFDFLSQQRIIYQQGVMDQTRNYGSAYVEQRFIVDGLSPVCTFNLPGATVDPAAGLVFDVTVADSGVGLDAGSVTVKITTPDGTVIELDPDEDEYQVVGDRITGKIDPPLDKGDYTITIEAKDRLGHTCTTSKTVTAEASLLTLDGAFGYPNPFNPDDGDGVLRIQLNMSKSSSVTAKVYDFAGEYVTTLLSSEELGTSGVIEWDGRTPDGTEMANGAYIVRVVATDGRRTESTNVKVVIWRE
jgi:flagellar hook assembly protein FlgD